VRGYLYFLFYGFLIGIGWRAFRLAWDLSVAGTPQNGMALHSAFMARATVDEHCKFPNFDVEVTVRSGIKMWLDLSSANF
jgi:hypothetical protein